MALDKNVPLVTNTIAADILAINANWEALVSDTAYDATTWDAVTDVAPSKNAVRDKIATIDAAITAAVSDTAYNATTWDAVTGVAPSKNAVRDKMVAVDAALAAQTHLLAAGATDVTATAAEINTGCDGILATAAEINTVADGLTAKNNHTHGIDAAAVGQGELKTLSGSVSTSSITFVLLTLPGGEYGFYPQIAAQNAIYKAFATICSTTGVASTSYITVIDLRCDGTGYFAYAQQRYITASGEIHWIFILKEKATGKIVSTWQAPDHPCFGNRGIIHPFPDYDSITQEIIIINPTHNDIERIQARCIPKVGGGYMTRAESLAGVEEDYFAPERDFMEVFHEMFEIQESKEADWPDIPITIALPKIHKGKIISDWRFMPQQVFNPETKEMESLRIQPIKRVIPKPDYITCLKIKEKLQLKHESI